MNKCDKITTINLQQIEVGTQVGTLGRWAPNSRAGVCKIKKSRFFYIYQADRVFAEGRILGFMLGQQVGRPTWALELSAKVLKPKVETRDKNI